MAEEIRTAIDKDRRGWIDEQIRSNYLDFSENKDIFFFALALGTETIPKKLKTRLDWIRKETFRDDGEALICAALLGKLCMDGGDVNANADFKICNEYAEQCAEAGFDELEKLINEAGQDNEMLCALLMNKLDDLYEQNVLSGKD